MTVRQQQRERWKQLSELLDRAERQGFDSLTVEEVRSLGRLYRHVTIDLSRARGGGADPDLVAYLNRLAARAHSHGYAARRIDLRPLAGFLVRGFPRAVRRNWRPLAASAAVFFLTALASFVAVVRDPELAYSLFDERMVEFENL